MTTVELSTMDATAQAELVRSGEVTALELVDAAIERIERLNPTLNAVITPMFDRARAVARTNPTGPFAGVPFLLKDLVAEVDGVPFSEGSVFVRGTTSGYTSELVTRLHRAGLVVVGKTNTPEFGMAPACEPVLHGATRNPWDLSRSTSGSSGGSAAAVAAGLVPMAHGNDLGGSIRFPAAACGLFGLKPTRARTPLGPEYGDVINGWAVEHALTLTVRDSAALLDAIAGPALGDPYQAPTPVRPFAEEVAVDPRRLRIAYSPRTPGGELGHPDCVAAVEDAAALCAALGHEVIEADLPGLDGEVGGAIGTVFNAATAWILAYWIRRVGREPRPGELEPLTVAYWDAGRQVSASDYLLAIETLQRFSRTVARFLTGVDLWLTPTMSEPPAPLGEITASPDDPLRAISRGARTVAYPAVIANITGNPAMSVPLWSNADGLPIGVHFLGRYGDEATLFQLAGQLERARPWAHRRPPTHATRL
ncbi:amidase [Kutzneria chonburiensis]|uniref:Amidase n=1 Tax=Kutzneria chonburiensis TaxID=1483604 RepID=A0ABV6MRI5_9PSEU|nr:amidase [Kutzneria chonburiensis]